MKPQRTLAVLFLTFVFLIGSVSTVFAMPPLPASFYGTAMIGGAYIPAGTVVSAWIGGVQYASDAVEIVGGQSVYSLGVPGDDAETEDVIEGGTQNQTIIFHIGGSVAQQTALWKTGTNTRLDLTVFVNSAPVITEGATALVTMSEDGSPTPFTLTLHATDVDVSDTLTWSISGAASHGNATASGTGSAKSIGYTPDANYSGSDSFTVQVADGNGSTDTITVSVTIQAVNDLPTLNNIANPAAINEDAGAQNVSLGGITAGGDESQQLQVTASSANTALIPNPTVTYTSPNETGSLSYTPVANAYGSAVITVTVTDSGLDGNLGTTDDNGTVQKTLTVNVNAVNDAPTSTGISTVSVAENAPNTSIDLWPVFADIEDADSVLTYTVTSNTNPTLFTSATITGHNLVLDYVAIGAGTANITVRATDTGSLFVETSFTVSVATTNLPPEITQGPSVGVTMSEDGAPTAFSLTLNATDANGDTLTWTVSTPAAHGTATASGTGLSKAITYVPAANYNGTDTFVVQVSDGRQGLDTINVNVTIQSVNDLPVITEGASVARTMSEDGLPTAFSLTLNATDVDATTITWSISTVAVHGTATASGTGTSKAIGYVPAANYSGTDSFVVRVSDGAGGSDTITVNVTIQAVNDAPVANPQSVTTLEDTPKVITLTGSDVEGSPLTFVVLSYPAHGGLSGTAPNITYTPNADYNGPDSFTFRANDGLLNSTAATISITVGPVNKPPTNITLSNSGINENRPAGTAIGNITTTDPDAGDTFTYSFCGGANDASFQIVGAQLRSGVMFDYETKSSYSICIRSTDSGLAHFDKAFTISINNLLDTGTFIDVPADHMFWRYIEGFYAAGITSGCSSTPMMFCPDQPVTRGQMAVFLEKALGNMAPVPNPSNMFNDVALDDPFKPFIEEFYNDGITSGCANNPLKYCPNQVVTRGQMAVFIEKALGNFAPTPNPTDMFNDVLVNDPFKPFIEEFYNDGITSGCTTNPLNYCPSHPVTRGQMAVFIAKAFNLPLP